MKYYTFTSTTTFFVVKSITSHKFNLSAFISAENIILKVLLLISLLIYRVMSSSLFIYKFYKKLYFIIANFYMRYALLSKFQVYNKIIYIINVLFIIFMQNFYKKIYNKKKLIIFTLNKIFNFSIN